MNKKVKEFQNKYPDYKIVNFINNYSAFYFYDEHNFLHKKNNIYRAINFKIGIESVVNKINYIQYKLNELEKNYIIVKYNGMRNKSTILLNNFTYEVVLSDLLTGHDVSNISCVDVVKSDISKSVKCGFSRSKFNSLYKNKIVILYLIEVFNKKESFYKIGLTCKKINQRFSGLSKFGYSYKTIDVIYIKGEDTYDKEKELKKACKNNNYIPLKKYPGYTESFNKQIKIIYEQFKKANSEVS